MTENKRMYRYEHQAQEWVRDDAAADTDDLNEDVIQWSSFLWEYAVSHKQAAFLMKVNRRLKEPLSAIVFTVVLDWLVRVSGGQWLDPSKEGYFHVPERQTLRDGRPVFFVEVHRFAHQLGTDWHEVEDALSQLARHGLIEKERAIAEEGPVLRVSVAEERLLKLFTTDDYSLWQDKSEGK